MNDEFSNIRFKMRMNILDNASDSLIVLEKDNDDIIYKMFTYMVLVEEDIKKIYDIVDVIEAKNGEVHVQRLDDVSRLIEVHRTRKMTRDEYYDLYDDYYDQIMKVKPIIYKDNLTEEESTIANEFRNTFNKLVEEDMQKLYEDYFPNFMAWIKNEK